MKQRQRFSHSIRRRIILVIFILTILALYPIFGFAEAAPSLQAATKLAHYIVFEQDSSGTIRPVFHQYVTLGVPLASASELEISESLAQPERNAYVLRLWLEDQSGRTVYRNITTVPRWLRGEFHGDAIGQGKFTIDSSVIPAEPSAFVVRVPVIPGTRLKLSGGRSTQTRSFDLDLLVQTPNLPLSGFALPAGTSIKGSVTNLNNRVNLLVMGDGYTAAESADFTSDAAAIMDDFFGITPYSEYRNYVDVQTLFIPSVESGADHPPYNATCTNSTCCADAEMLNDPLRGTFVNTALDSRYCTSNIHRLLTTNASKTYAAAAAVPDFDEIMVIVNDTTYGGSGGSFSVLSIHNRAVEVAQHEYGHSFTNLADEYDSPYPGYPSCSDVSSPPCEANVTDQSQRTLIKWLRWILESTPVTTPENDPTYYTVIGLFEGARYLSTGMYRNTNYSLMRVLGEPFREVNSEAYVLRLYNGGWGVPLNGIDNIEPGTENPSPSSTIPLNHPGSVTLSATLLAPVIGPDLQVNWYVDDALFASDTSKTSASFTFESSAAGTFNVRLEVIDTSPLIHSTQQSSIKSTREWTVRVLELIPSLTSPANSSFKKDNTPTFSWQAASSATVYRIQIANNSSFTNPVINTTVAQTRFTPTQTLSDGEYFWRVRGGTGDGIWGRWSSVWSLQIDTVPPARPVLTTPADEATLTDTTPTLGCRAVSGATLYQFQIDNNSDFSSPVIDLIRNRRYFTPLMELSSRLYYWRVRAKDAAGNVSPWSTRRSFRITNGVGGPGTTPPTLVPGAIVVFPTLMPTRVTPSSTLTPTEVVSVPLLRVESDQPFVQQTGTWAAHSTDAASGGSYLYSSGSFEDALTLAFAGTQVEVIYVKHPALGTFAVEIDETMMQLVDSVAAESEFGAVTLISGLAAGPHILRVYPVAGVIALDAFGVETVSDIPAPTTTPVPTQDVQPTSAPTNLPPGEPTVMATATSAPQPVLLPFVETFDSGLNWLATGAWTFDAQMAYRGAGWFASSTTRGQSSTLTFGAVIDLRTALNPELRFWQKLALASEDQLVVDVSMDGGLTWQVVDLQAGPVIDWTQRMLDLTPYSGYVLSLRFRLDTTNPLPEGMTSTGVWIDELVIQEAHLVPTQVPTSTATATDLPTNTVAPTETPLPGDTPTETPPPTETPTDIPTEDAVATEELAS
jgi:hypothetical protein